MSPQTPSESNNGDPIFDPFPHSQLFPDGWDLSDHSSRAIAQPGEPNLPFWYNPFQEPRTFPAGWALHE